VVDPAPIQAHPATLTALILFTLASLGLGFVARFAASREGGFLRKYFLGNRSLGALAVALTAAVMSGGTFMGFPSLVYTFGWVVGLWIGSYMIFPMTVLGVLGKRIGQLSRRTGAITLPDLLRERYSSPALGLLTSLLIMTFLTINLIPQFKAGAVIVKTVLPASVVARFTPEGPGSVTDTVTEGAFPGEADPAAATSPAPAGPQLDVAYLIGLTIFAVTVIAYTTYGGFLAAVWTDVFQSLVMAVGVMILFPLAMRASGGMAQATYLGMQQAGPGFAFGPGAGRNFHPLTLAISFFFMWAISAMGQPSTMVRLMAFKSTRTLRYAILWLTTYNLIIYVPLIFIFIAARNILPGLDDAGLSDEVMPRICVRLANPYVAGLILAAPYGAVMSTVSAFLLIVSSGLVRDIYQRFLRPAASEREVEWASYLATLAVGLLAALAATNPPAYLQLLIVFTSAAMAAAFLAPAAMGCFWRRATAPGALAAMIAGAGTTVALYAVGWVLGRSGFDQGIGPPPKPPAYGPYYLLGFDPVVWGLSASFLAGIVVSLLTRPPEPSRVALLFDAHPPGSPGSEDAQSGTTPGSRPAGESGA